MLPKVKLSKCAKIYSGNSIPKKIKEEKYLGISSGTAYVATKDINTNHLIDYDNGVKIPFDDSKKFKLAPRGSVLICAEGGSAGKKIAYNDQEDIFFVNKLFCINPTEDVLAKYIFYYLKSNEFQIDFNSQLTGLIGGVSLSKFKKLSIPLAPISDQKRIVGLLDQYFNQISQAKNIATNNSLNADELFSSSIDSALNQYHLKSQKVKLSEICDYRSITYGVIKLGDHINNGVPCLRTSDVKRLTIDTNGMKLISPDLSKDYDRTVLCGGEVLVNIRGTLGGVAVAEDRMKGWNVSREVATVPVSKEKAIPEYVAYWIASSKSQSWLTGVQKGAAYTGINLSDLRNLPIYIPSIGEQRAIVKKLDGLKNNCDFLLKNYQNSLTCLIELESSLLNKAFNGELTANLDEVA